MKSISTSSVRLLIHSLPFTLLCLGTITSCSDTDGSDSREETTDNADKPKETDTSEDAGEKANDAGPADSGSDRDEDVLYAITTQVFGADTTESYVMLTDTLSTKQPLSLDEAIEIPGRALGVGPDGKGRLYVAGDASATVTRYDLDGNDKLSKGESLSFQGKGLAALGEYGGQFQFVEEDKAYYFDGPTGQVIIWDPESMIVTGDISLGEFVLEDTILTFSASPVWVDNDTLVNFAGWREGATVPSLAGVVSIDTSADEATVVTDDRCGYVRDGVLADDGYIYVATEAYGASVHRLNEDNAAPSCLLRFDPETNRFDDDFYVELSDLFDGAAAGSLVVGSGDQAFLKVLDEDVAGISEDTHPRVLASAAAWRWATLTPGNEPQVDLLELAPDNGSVVVLELGERRFMALSVGRDSTNIVELTNAGPGEASTSIPGIVFSAVKLR